MKAFPTSYVSIKVLDYHNNQRWAEDYFTSFHAKPGNQTDIYAKGKWGSLKFFGSAETQWDIHVETKEVKADIIQKPLVPIHRNRLYTKKINYFITQFIKNEMSGNLAINNSKMLNIKGFGYSEHNWGIQPSHSTTHWLHFWAQNIAGIVMDCRYDTGLAHNYNFFWFNDNGFYLPAPSNFHYDPENPMKPFMIESPDLKIKAVPITSHFTRKKIWPILNIDYQEILLYVKGWVYYRGNEISIDGIGKIDHNFNKW